jgi:hypothetical protein
MRIRARIVLLATLAMLLSAGAANATGRAPSPIYDGCYAWEHFPDQPISGAPSIFGYYGSFGTAFGGGFFNFYYESNGEEQVGQGLIDVNGIGHGYGPLWEYGPHPITRAYVMFGEMMYDLDVSNLPSADVDDSNKECDPDRLSVFETSLDTTDEPEESEEPEEVTDSTEPPAESEPEAESTPATEATITTEVTLTDSGGNTYGGWYWFGGILLIVGGGLYFLVTSDKADCIPLYVAWQQAKKACETAEAEVAKRKGMVQKAKDGLADQQRERKKWEDLVTEIEAELDQLKRSRGTSVGTGGTTFHRIPEGLVTAEGLESIIDAVQARLDSAKGNVPDISASEREWEKRVAEQEKALAEAEARAKTLCDQAAAAKKA